MTSWGHSSDALLTRGTSPHCEGNPRDVHDRGGMPCRLRGARGRMRAPAAVKVGPCHTDVSVTPPPRHPSPLSFSASWRALQSPKRGRSRAPSATATQTPTPIATRSPGATPAAQVQLPTDCRAILSDDVLAELDGVTLNDASYGDEVGVQADGSLVCLWGSPETDTGRLTTTISVISRGPALDLLNAARRRGRLHLLHPRRRHPMRDDVGGRDVSRHGRPHRVLARRHPDRHGVLEPRAERLYGGDRRERVRLSLSRPEPVAGWACRLGCGSPSRAGPVEGGPFSPRSGPRCAGRSPRDATSSPCSTATGLRVRCAPRPRRLGRGCSAGHRPRGCT